MSTRYIVNPNDQFFRRVTQYKGRNGLGQPYVPSGSEIIFTREQLDAKLVEFTRLRGLWAGTPGYPPREDDRSLRSSRLRVFKRDVYRTLFPEDTVGDNVIQEYFGWTLSFGEPGNVVRLTNILDEYITLINRILTPIPGLSRIEVTPTEPTFTKQLVPVTGLIARRTVEFPFLTIRKVEIDVLGILLQNTRQILETQTTNFFDDTRELKTILGVGSDSQYVIEAWRPVSYSDREVQVKLLTPLADEFDRGDVVHIVRELAKPVVDNVTIEYTPFADDTPFLRPRNMDVKVAVGQYQNLKGVTLSSLGLTTGSAGYVTSSVSYEDRVFNRWFTTDFKSSELNIDFSDYKNFVHFGSAKARLLAFAEKLSKLESLDSTFGVSSSVVSVQRVAQEKEAIRRNFDPYEQYLYYATTQTPYSSSITYDDVVEYHVSGSWPKDGTGLVLSTTDPVALDWFVTQSSIAERFDETNPNFLVKFLPQHILEDEESSEFITFVSMFGHVMDNLKVYIDQFPNIYSTSPNPFDELTMDQVYEVAQSFGLKLPNAYSLESLQSFISSVYEGEGARSYVAETWKRFIHSAVYLRKTKGSRAGLDAILNTYGISTPIIQPKETAYPTYDNFISSDELTYGLRFTGSLANRLLVPFVSSSVVASSVQIRFNPFARQTSTLLGNGGEWSLDLVPHPTTSREDYGRLHVVSGSARTIIATSSYFPLFSDDYTHLMFRSRSADLTIIQTDGDQILYQQTIPLFSASLWNGTSVMTVGGSGSVNFDGIVDEIHVWEEEITDELFVKQAYDPGSYYGASYTSSYANLPIHLAFSQVLSSITSSVVNESPNPAVPTVSAALFTTASFIRLQRGIKQFTPLVGSTAYTNNLVRVAEPPTFNENYRDEDGVYILHPKASIKTVEEKKFLGGQDEIYFGISPTDYINQNIIRTMGQVNVNQLIGSPRKIADSSYPDLDELYEYYLTYYHQSIRVNDYIRFFSNLLKGPTETIEDMVPARAKLVNGIIIQSPILHRTKTEIARDISVSGTGTTKFEGMVAGSGSAGVGAGSFSDTIELSTYSQLTGDTTPISGDLDTQDYDFIKSSTPVSELPSNKRALQLVNGVFVTSSLMDTNSGIATIESEIEGYAVTQVTSSGYPRDAYEGIFGRIPSEVDTVTPFYDIPPRSDLNDVGTTTYFSREDGLYYLTRGASETKRRYLTLFNAGTNLPLGLVNSSINLLPEDTIINLPERDSVTFGPTSLTSGSIHQSVTSMANIATLLGVEGSTGIRLRLYSSLEAQLNDTNRAFSTTPDINSGVLLDVILEGQSDVNPYVMVQTTDSRVYYTLNNTTASTVTGRIVLFFFAFEPASLVPRGYLPRHYKFNRDNSVAKRRRNVGGCRIVYCDTIICGRIPTGSALISDFETTDDAFVGRDGLEEPPVVIELVSRNTAAVNNPTNTPNTPRTPGFDPYDDIVKFGGGGPLDA